jgi:hypothetical protein
MVVRQRSVGFGASSPLCNDRCELETVNSQRCHGRRQIDAALSLPA